VTETARARADWLRHVSGRVFINDAPKRVGVAVSGGGDSMALLDLMLWHTQDRGFTVKAVTLDHGLRTASAEEAAHVAAFCAERDVPHDVLTWSCDGTGNLPARARAARYDLIGQWARSRELDMVMLGHTRQDIAETFLMRLARGAGLDGLSAMAQRFDRNDTHWARPLLLCDRDVLRDYLHDRGIGWHEDPTNDDPAYDRSRARQVLDTLAPLGISVGTLVDAAFHLGSARHALEHVTRTEAQRLVAADRGDLILSPNPMPPAPPEIHRRLLVRALQWVSGAEYPPRRSALINLDAALTDNGRHTVAGCLVLREQGQRRREDTLRITREWNAVRQLDTPSDAIWDGRWRLNGPHSAGLTIRALGEAVRDCPGWRETGLPRASLRASPAVWRGPDLIAAPLAGLANGWSAALAKPRDDFNAWLL